MRRQAVPLKKLRHFLSLAMLATCLACAPGASPGPQAAPEGSAETPPGEGRSAAAPRPDPAVLQDVELRIRFTLPEQGWEPIAPAASLPGALLQMRSTTSETSFALLPVLSPTDEVTRVGDTRALARQHLERHAKVIKVTRARMEQWRRMGTTLTLAEGLVDQKLVHLAHQLVVAPKGYLNFLVWGPLTRSEPEELTGIVRQMIGRLEFLGDEVEVLRAPGAAADWRARGRGPEGVTQARLRGDFQPGLDFVDAAYSEALGRLVAVAANPPAVHLIEPDGLAAATIPLEHPPLAVALSPDGTRALVGLARELTLIDVAAATRLTSRPLSFEPGSLALSDDGWAYTLPASGQWVRLVGIEMEEGGELENSGQPVFAGLQLRLHPDGQRLYAVDTGLSPARMRHFDVSRGRPDAGREWSYKGPQRIHGDLWISHDGTRIYTAGGAIFGAARAAGADMRFLTQLRGIPPHLPLLGFAESPAGDLLAVIQEPLIATRGFDEGGTAVHFFDAHTLEPAGVQAMPSMRVGGEEVEALARRVFFAADGKRIHVIARALADEEPLPQWTVMTFPVPRRD